MELGSNISLETHPLHDMDVMGVDPASLVLDIGHGLTLLRDLRRDHGDRGDIDGFVAVNSIPTLGRTFDELGAGWPAARAAGMTAREYFFRNVDMGSAALGVRDADPDELIGPYMTHVDSNVLRVPTSHPHHIALPYLADVPGTRFTNMFQDDNDVVAMGRIWQGDIKGGREAIDNSMYLSLLLDGMIPNFNGRISLDRSHLPTETLAIERLAAAYGKEGPQVIEHYREPLRKHLAFWMRGRSYLEGIRHNDGATYGRQMLLAGPGHDIVFRHNSDARINFFDAMRGLREESAAEDEELAETVLGSLSGIDAAVRFEKLMRDLRGACESTQDFADWQLADYFNLETIRTTDIAPVALQALMVKLMRMAGAEREADQLGDVIMNRFYKDIDDTHAQFVDLLQDGTPTKALHAAQAYPLLVGGIVPYDKAIKLANTWRDVLVRPYGVMISAGRADQQWSGNPSPSNNGHENDMFRRLVDPAYNPLNDVEGDNRAWPSVGLLLAEGFLTAAIEAKLNGHDPEPLLEVAEMIKEGTVEGIRASFNANHFVGEKFNAVNPVQFVNGGEYGATLETAQRGFGMTIGAFRSLAGRSFRGELSFPEEYWWRQDTLRHIRVKAGRTAGGLAVATSFSSIFN